MMKKIKKVRWDPMIAKLADNDMKQNFCADTNKHYMTSSKADGVVMPQERRSKEDFKVYLKSLFNHDTLQVKYQNPDAWRIPEKKKKIIHSTDP